MGVYMKKRMLSHFIIGIVTSFTIEILVMTLAVAMAGSDTIPVSMIGQAFALAISCSLIGAVFSADRLNLILQTVFTYIFSLATVLLFSLMFQWNSMGEGIFNGKSFFAIMVGLFTLGYIITMAFTWEYQKKKNKLMNEKLAEYKETVEKKKQADGR